VLLKGLAPLAYGPTKLAFSSYTDVKHVIGEDSYAKTESELLEAYDSTKTIPQLVFLGLDEHEHVTDESQPLTYASYKGKAFFALDVTPKGSVTESCQELIEAKKSAGLTFLEGRMHLSLPAHEAAIFAASRSMLDWNARNPYCAGCGQPTLSINAGFKRTCPPTDWGNISEKGTIGSTTADKPYKRPDCATRHGISNLAFPRTDPTVIMACLSADSKRILLGRQGRFPPNWYSCLAGFVEPGESVEEAVRREVDEESGVQLGRVVIHSTQPWPYPNSLMIGAVAQATAEGESIKLNDKELDDARWFTVEEVREALRVGVGRLDQTDSVHPEYKEGNLRLPPETAIANRLLEAVCGGFAGPIGTSNL
jgi:NAD+ diphosphatase